MTPTPPATELGHLGTNSNGITYCRAVAVNIGGTAVGYANGYNSGTTSLLAVRWDASTTTVTELGNLGTASDGHTACMAYDINAAGTAVGWAYWRAVRWDASTTAATELGNLADGWSRAHAINDAGIAVGFAETNDRHVGQRAVAWGIDGAAFDLNTLLEPNSGWVLTDARSISNSGWITGTGRFDPGGGQEPYLRVFLLQIPEPAALVTLVLPALLLRDYRSYKTEVAARSNKPPRHITIELLPSAFCFLPSCERSGSAAGL
jgi:hypothetical protein